MLIKIEKPPIPVLWLDTWFILELTKALNGSSKKDKKWADEIVDKIISLTKQKRILCPEADQGIEIEVSNNRSLVENAGRLQAQLSLGISLHFHAAAKSLQIQRMMEAVIKNKKEVTFPWKDLFNDDPIEVIDRADKFIVSVISRPPLNQIKKTIKTNKSIATAWEKLRKKARKNKQNYETTLSLEFGGRAEAMIHTMSFLAAKTLHKKRIFIKDILNASELVGKPLGWWERYSGKSDALVDVLKFYKSEEYKQIPAVNIDTRLLAELACGNEPINPSDVMDIHHVSTVMSYAHYMLVDKRMRNRIVDKLKLTKDYPCIILRPQDLMPLLKSLEAK